MLTQIQVILALALLASVSSEPMFQEKYFKQKLDHFSYTNAKYFKQRYLIDDQYSRQDSPIFFYCGNEGDINVFANNTGFIWELAETFGARLVYAEHRFYGKSIPADCACLENKEELGYLTVEQALMDYAVILTKEFDAPNKKVIAFGGSYGGMLAAWIRIKFPHLVFGALASSAPILQFSDLTPCNTFSEITTDAYRLVSEECVKSINASWCYIRSAGESYTNLKRLSKIFHLCQPLKTQEDLDNFVDWLQDIWSFLAMTNYPYPTDFLNPLPANPIEVVCSHLCNSTQPPKELLKNIAEAAFVFLNYTGQVKDCFNVTTSSKALGMKAWDFQSCTELVSPMCSTGQTDMFEPSPWNYEAYKDDCQKEFGVTPNILKIRLLFGGCKINASSNIIFSNGLLDPWSGGGVLEDISSTIQAIVMKDGVHHSDLRTPNPEDSCSVKKARYRERAIIKNWLTCC